MRRKFLIPFLLIVIFELSPCGAASLIAQTPEVQDTVRVHKYNFSEFGHETWRFIKQPTKWDGSDWLRIGVVGGGTFLLMQVDQPIRDMVVKDQRYYKSVPIEGGRMWAELYPPVLLFAGFATHSLITDDIRTRKVAYEIAQAMLYAGLVDKILSISFGRAKPFINEGPKTFHPFLTIDPLLQDNQSMPGGHCVIGFALSTVLSRNAGPLWLKTLAYVPAALTFVSRVYQDRHWTSDDFLGASLGYFVATWVVDLHEQQNSRVQVSSVFPLTISVTLN
jgi:membrane-associated phospholipid phosphatase